MHKYKKKKLNQKFYKKFSFGYMEKPTKQKELKYIKFNKKVICFYMV